jgi:hypothetical protein
MLHVPGLTEVSPQVWDLKCILIGCNEELKDHKDVVLVGHSNGGRIAIAYTAKHPEHIKKLILIDAAGIVHNEPLLRAKRLIFGALAKVGKKITSVSRIFEKHFTNLFGRGIMNKRRSICAKRCIILLRLI